MAAEKSGRTFRIPATALAEYARRRPKRPARSQESVLRALPRPEPVRLGSLPAPLNRFVGREGQIGEIGALVRRDGVRLVTLTGPGGVGKTRIALRVAEEGQADFADGAAFVALAPTCAAGLVLPAIVQALRITEHETLPPLERLAGVLRERELLLVLDNFEQVLEAAPAVADLLGVAPRVTILVTSRAPLRLPGERLIAVPPLALPRRAGSVAAAGSTAQMEVVAEAEAVALFVERAQEVAAEFALTAENAAAVAAICARADGLPLAIELAAARTRVLAPAELLARMSPRLPVLGGGPRDQPDRLRTMRDAIAWSHGLLSWEEQLLFRRLAVFVGGWTLDAAARVAGGLPSSVIPDLLASLVDQSLVQRASGDSEDGRFSMLETIREYGLEQLAASGEETAIRDAHAAWCLDFAERAAPELAGPDHVAWFNRLEAEIGNVRAAHHWLFARNDVERNLRLGVTLSWFWQAAGYFQEGRALFARLLAMPGAESAPAAFAEALGAAGSIEHQLGDLDAAHRHVSQALAIARDLGDRRGVVAARRTLGSIAIDRGDLDLAPRVLADVAASGAEVGGAWEAVSAEHLLGIIAFTRGDYAAAMRHADAARNQWLALGDLGHAGGAQSAFARAALAAGDLGQAAIKGHDLLGQLGDVEDDTYTTECFELAAALNLGRGQPRRAARLLAAAEAMRSRIGTPPRPGVQAWLDRLYDATRHAVGASRLAADSSAGAALSLAEATAEAFAAFADARPGKARGKMPSAPGALSPREREILHLLADGLADKEIAAALGISRHTASNHVTAIRRKLGVPSRTAAAAIARRNTLL